MKFFDVHKDKQISSRNKIQRLKQEFIFMHSLS